MRCHDTCCVPERDDDLCLTTTRTAHKQHACDQCPAPIRPGQAYQRHFFPDSRTTYAVHMPGACRWEEP